MGVLKSILGLTLILVLTASFAYSEITPDDYFNTYNCAYWNQSDATNSGYMFYDDFNTTESNPALHKPDWSANIATTWGVAEGSVSINANQILLSASASEDRLTYNNFAENASNYTINYFMKCDTPPTNSVSFGFQFANGLSGKIDGGGLLQSNAGFTFEGGDSGVDYTVNSWNMITAIADPVNNQYCFYTNVTDLLGCASDASVVDSFQIRYGRAGSTCRVDNFVSFVGSGIADCPSAAAPSSDPTITFHNQSPPDIVGLNVMEGGISIYYNITDTDNINVSTVRLYYKANSTDRDYNQIVNGSAVVGIKEKNGTNDTITWQFALDDNIVYGGSYNIDHDVMEDTAHLNYMLDNQNYYAKLEIYNVSINKPVSVLEIMAINLSSTSAPLEVMYCNSSYSTGNPQISPFCTDIFNLPANKALNHTHSVNSNHAVIPFTFNSSGEINSVRVTETSYFLFRGLSPGMNSWNLSYIPDIARSGASQTTTNGGASWSDLSGEFDGHLHQFNETDAVYYFAGACDGLGNCINSTQRSDNISQVLLPPTAPPVHNPVNKSFNGDILVNWSAAISPNGLAITYNLSILNQSFQKEADIIGGLTNFSYTFDGTVYDDGNYTVRVTAIDNESQQSDGFSSIFIIDTTLPVLTITNPSNLTNHSKADGALSVNMICTDANPYLLNYTFSFSNGTVMTTEQTASAVGNQLTIASSIDVSTYPVGTYLFNGTCSDDHTYGDLHNLTYTTYNGSILSFYKLQFPDNKLNLTLGYLLNGEVNRVSDAQVDSFNIKTYIVKQDTEYNFGMLFDLPASDFRFGFKTPKRDDLILRDETDAHFVWRNLYYVDYDAKVCEWNNGNPINCRSGSPTLAQTANSWHIYYDYNLHNWFQTDDRLVFYTESIGGLNIVETSHTVYLNNATAAPGAQALVITTCPTDLSDVGLFVIFIILAVLFIIIGIGADIPIMGISGSVILFFVGLNMVPCQNAIGLILAGTSGLLAFRFLLVGFKPKRQF